MSNNSSTYKKVLSKGIQNNLPDIENGKLRFTTDTGRLFLDDNGKRIEITDFVKDKTKDEILSIEYPLPKIYLASDTLELYCYNNGEWKAISGQSEDTKVTQTPISDETGIYRLLLSESDDDETHTEGTRKTSKLLFNAETNSVTIGTRYEGSTEGEYSIAIGLDVEASARNSHAEGHETSASGESSHAEGTGTYAGNDNAHAEGFRTTANGYYSHSEGHETSASGSTSHAEGFRTTANGYYSHAEGQETIAYDYYAHAEGNATTASGSNSHAEGYYTCASSDSSHAEGSGTTASGYNSHAEGHETEASGENSHAEGEQTTASNSAHAEGNNTYASNWASHTEGYETYAGGETSHAEGYDTEATGNYSHAEGYETYAGGEASHAEGYVTIAEGDYSHSEGYNTTASGDYGSHAEGQETVSSGLCSHAEGSHTLASGDSAHAEGSYTCASGNYSAHAEGTYTTASGNYSHAEGESTLASADSTHAEGSFTEAIQSGAHAEGVSTKSTACSSHSEGDYTTASGDSAHAEGSYTCASGTNAHTEGQNTSAASYNSHAEGSYTYAYGEISHVEGEGTISNHKNQHVFGRYNIEDPHPGSISEEGYYVEIVGNGDDSTSVRRSNARTLDWNGNEWLSGSLRVGNVSSTPYDNTMVNGNGVTVMRLNENEDIESLLISSYDLTLSNSTWDGTNARLKDAIAAISGGGGNNILKGLSAPTSDQGVDGDLYVKLRPLDPYLDNFVINYDEGYPQWVDTGLDISNLHSCKLYIKMYQMVADVETLVYEYEEQVDFQNFSTPHTIYADTTPVGSLYLSSSAGQPESYLCVEKDRPDQVQEKWIMTVIDATATADAIDTIYIKDNGEWLADNDNTIPSPTSEDVDKILGATDVGKYGWVDSIRFFDSGASAEVYTDHISVNQAGYSGSSMTRDEIQISNIMGSSIKMTSDDITLGSTWDGTNTGLKDAIAAASGSEAVYKTLAEYEALPTADKEDPTKIYFVINEGYKISPTLDADDGNISVSSYQNNYDPWHAFDGSTRSDIGTANYCWAAWGQHNGEWIAYSFDSQQQFSKVRFRSCQEGTTTDITFKYYVEGSNDGTTWNNLLLNKEYESIAMPKANNTSPITFNFVDFNFILDTTLPTYSKIRVRVDQSIGFPYSSNRWSVANFDIYAANTSAIPMIYYKDVLYNPQIKELPNTVVADAGKALIVNSEGEWDKGNIPRTNSVQVPPIIYDNGKLMKIADMTGFPELEKVFVTSEEYAQLTTAQKQDLSKIYYVSPYKFYTLKDGEITIRVNGTTYEWFFNGFILTSNFYTIPSEYRQYTKNDPYEGSTAWSDNTSSTSLGIIEMGPNGYTERISAQDGNWGGNYILNTPIYGKVIIGNGDSQGNSYSDPYDVDTPILIYYGGKQYTEYTTPSVYRELTQQEYDALPSSKESDGIIYFITDNS